MGVAGVEHALCMPKWKITEDDPLGIAETLEIASLTPGLGLHPVGFADPTRTDEGHLRRVDEALKNRRVKALKAYLGYLHHGADSPGYRPYYELGAKHNIPVIFHTGDNYSRLAKVKYAHPLSIDEVAVDHPATRFVIAHMGYPWLVDAAEVIFKNNQSGGPENVWADLSGFVVGTAEDFAHLRRQGSLELVIAEVRKSLYYTQRPDRLMFGSDWPLAPMSVYRDFIGELVPGEYHQQVFRENALKFFDLGNRVSPA
jgi:predicted TIM-barrel fold metal-dependent hydrolase